MKQEIQVPLHAGTIGGEFRLVVINPDGSVDQDTGWLKNRITDVGLRMYGRRETSDNNWWQYNCIGSSNTATTDTMTDLVSELAFNVSTSGADVSNNEGPPNYEFYQTRKWRYSAGSGTGTIREVGMRSNAAGRLFCRHVVTPEVTKSAVQVLDVYYKFTVYPSLTENTGTIVIDGITYDWACSCYDLGNTENAEVGTFENGGYPNTYYNYNGFWDGAKAGLLDSSPQGTKIGTAGTSGSDGTAYVQHPAGAIPDLTQDLVVTWGLNVNGGNGFCRTMVHRTLTGKVRHQIEFTQQAGQPNPGFGIPKDETEELYTRVRFSWGRH